MKKINSFAKLMDTVPAEIVAFAATEKATHLRYTYPVLPAGLFTEVVTKLQKVIERKGSKRQQFSNGVVLTMNGARALLIVAPQDQQICLIATGPVLGRRELVGLCRSTMHSIHVADKSVMPLEEIQGDGEWSDTVGIEANEKALQRAPLYFGGQAPQQGTQAAPDNDHKHVPVALLNRKPKVFISYSKGDSGKRDSLIKQLNILINEGLASQHWHDRMIVPGDQWDNEIQAELNDADVIIILVSNDALATDYIAKYEIPYALKRHNEGTAQVVPVILEDCRWDKTLLAKLNVLPEKGVPITEWSPNQKAGWRNVGDGLARVLTRVLGQV